MKKKSLVVAMGLGLAISSVAQADSLLFPYYKTGNGAYTFLSLYSSVAASTHYIWNYDNPATPAAECQHEDAYGALTANDIIQHEVSQPSLSGINLQTQFGDKSTANYSYNSPAEGFIIISSEVTAGGVDQPESTLQGQAIVIDTANGTVTAYRGMNNPGTTDEGTWNNILTSHPAYDLTWYPTSVVNTSWYVLVTGVGMANVNNWQGAGFMSNGFGNVYDRDENPRSGNIDNEVVCHEFLDRSDIMTSAQLAHSNNGGYMFSVWTNELLTGATGIMMSKIETTSALGGVGVVSSEAAFPNLPY